MKVTIPQAKLISFLKSHAGKMLLEAANKSFDARVVNSAIKRGFVAVEGEIDKMLILTEQGRTAEAAPEKVKAPKAPKAAKKAKKAPKAAKAKREPKVKAEALVCFCGCGKKTADHKRRFLQGHDARLHSHVLKVGKGEMAKSTVPTERPEVMEFIKTAKWATDEVLKAFRAAK